MKKILTILFLLSAIFILSCSIVAEKDDPTYTPHVQEPIITPSGGSFNTAKLITMRCPDQDTYIFYTLDGSYPTTSSTLYTSPITIMATTTIRAIAVSLYNYSSNVATALIVINNLTPQPIISPSSGSFSSSQVVSISCTDESAQIFYTLDNSIPTINSSLYNEPLFISHTTTIKAIAVSQTNIASIPVSALIIINPIANPNPVISPSGGSFSSPQYVSIGCNDQTANIYYTLDGSIPNASSNLYSTPILINHSVTLKTIAINQSHISSSVVTALFTINNNNIQMVDVAGGSFQMGRIGFDIDEIPVHTVNLSAFKISKYEITQAQWLEVMGYSPASSLGNGSNYPVSFINWYETLVFCNKKSIDDGLTPCYSKNGQSNPDYWGSIPENNDSIWNNITCNFNANGYRLPTEAEWEFAARGGLSTQQYLFAGSDDVNDVAWNSSNSINTTHIVGALTPNELGLYDMSGNVFEMCWDWYGLNYYEDSSLNNPIGPGSGSFKVYRGGSYYNFGYGNSDCRTTNRGNGYLHYKSNAIGFRIVKR